MRFTAIYFFVDIFRHFFRDQAGRYTYIHTYDIRRSFVPLRRQRGPRGVNAKKGTRAGRIR